MTFRVRPEARADIFDAAQWYEDREPGLGVAFIAEIDAAFQRIELGPERYTFDLSAIAASSCPPLPLCCLFWSGRGGHSDIRRPASASRP
jgi:hypothetical protein